MADENYYYSDPEFQLEINMHNLRREMTQMLVDCDTLYCSLCPTLNCKCKKEKEVQKEVKKDKKKDIQPNGVPSPLPEPNGESESFASSSASAKGPGPNINIWMDISTNISKSGALLQMFGIGQIRTEAKSISDIVCIPYQNLRTAMSRSDSAVL